MFYTMMITACAAVRNARTVSKGAGCAMLTHPWTQFGQAQPDVKCTRAGQQGIRRGCQGLQNMGSFAMFGAVTATNEAREVLGLCARPLNFASLPCKHTRTNAGMGRSIGGAKTSFTSTCKQRCLPAPVRNARLPTVVRRQRSWRPRDRVGSFLHQTKQTKHRWIAQNMPKRMGAARHAISQCALCGRLANVRAGQRCWRQTREAKRGVRGLTTGILHSPLVGPHWSPP